MSKEEFMSVGWMSSHNKKKKLYATRINRHKIISVNRRDNTKNFTEASLPPFTINFEMVSITQGIPCDFAWVSTDNNISEEMRYNNVKVILEHDDSGSINLYLDSDDILDYTMFRITKNIFDEKILMANLSARPKVTIYLLKPEVKLIVRAYEESYGLKLFKTLIGILKGDLSFTDFPLHKTQAPTRGIHCDDPSITQENLNMLKRKYVPNTYSKQHKRHMMCGPFTPTNNLHLQHNAMSKHYNSESEKPSFVNNKMLSRPLLFLYSSHQTPHFEKGEILDDGNLKLHKAPLLDNRHNLQRTTFTQSFYEFGSKPIRKLGGKPLSFQHSPLSILMSPKHMVQFNGFQNLGNTCYVNVILQSLLNIKPFRMDLLDPKYVNDSIPENTLYRSLTNVFKKSTSSSSTVSPSLLKECIARTSNRFSNNKQEDAHEFLSICLEQLHQDLKKHYNKEGDTLSPVDSEPCLVNRNFQCEVDHTVICSHCGHKSSHTETYRDFSLDLPDAEWGLDPDLPVDLELLLHKFFELQDMTFIRPFICHALILF
ncbi:hypothetical protein BC937DRAFT_86147 [Endogone sp. FLAS-F59071]|nr:hypothetical protein BC937DRAFT_86147 [Endogone sp. FLAS-F59071]|eukprot:RUS23462.1 hypothetical protein BC937DRAFT_86147 [Endogone sp. FLAS-F59071]